MRRDAPEDKLVLFAEVREEIAAQLTECVVQTFEESSFSVSAAVTRLPSRLVLLAFISLSCKGSVPLQQGICSTSVTHKFTVSSFPQ